MKNTGAFSLRAHEVGAVPIVRHFFNRLGLDRLLDTYVPETALGRPSKLPHSRAVSVMVMNAVLCREPLYGVPQQGLSKVDHRQRARGCRAHISTVR